MRNPLSPQNEDFICFLQLHLTFSPPPLLSWFQVPSIPFPIKLNSLLTGVRRSHEADRIRTQHFLSANNHRSLHSKSLGNGVWTQGISSVYPFYLFLICINGNSVCFNLYDGSRLRSNRNAACLLYSHWVHNLLAAKDFKAFFDVSWQPSMQQILHLKTEH